MYSNWHSNVKPSVNSINLPLPLSLDPCLALTPAHTNP